MKKIVKLTATFDVTDLPSFDSLKPYALTYKEEIDLVEDGKTEQPKKIARLPHGHPAPTCIMEHYTIDGVFLQSTALGWVRARQPQFGESSIVPTMSTLVRDRFVQRIEQGKFRFIKQMPGVKIIGDANGQR